MKSFTDIEQSKKLAEILPIESADMWYWKSPTTGFVPEHPMFHKSEHLLNIPAWSLSTLLDLLPNNEHIETTISRGGWEIEPVEYLPNTWWCIYEDTKNQTEFNISADNPVDACVEMILKLHEQNIL